MTEELLRKVRAMAPWHMNIALTTDLRTGDGNRGTDDGADPSISLIDPGELRPLLERLYPTGMAGKRFLDCACNAGGYSLLANELGATSFGFDVREHWIDQARFLRRHLGRSEDEVRFEVCDLLEVDRLLGGERFDVCLFKGIFYHLPDPVAGLKLVADRTDEVVVLDTASVSGIDDGFLQLVWEGVVKPKSGVHHLSWRPTGPNVLVRILEWLGFEATRVLFARERPPPYDRPGRIRIVGARDAEILAGLAVPPSTSVLVPRDGEVVSGTIPLDAGTVDDLVDVGRIEFRLASGDDDGIVLGEARRTWSGWIYMWDTTSVENGEHTVYSVATDLAGNVGRSAGVTVTVQNRRRRRRRRD